MINWMGPCALYLWPAAFVQSDLSPALDFLMPHSLYFTILLACQCTTSLTALGTDNLAYSTDPDCVPSFANSCSFRCQLLES